MPLKFSYIWQGSDDIPLFKWLYSGQNKIKNNAYEKEEVVHLYSMFINRPADPEIWQVGKRVFYSGEAVMDETHADVVVRFMPADDTTNPRPVLDMTPPYKQIVANSNRVGARYIQLRLQELDAIEWKIRGVMGAGVLDEQCYNRVRDYLLSAENITPYVDMMLSWARNKPVVGMDGSDSGNRKFCLFLVSNPACKIRNDTFMLLSRVGQVVSAGGFRNNLGEGDTRPPDRMNHDEHIRYLRQFRFMITFENQSLIGYHTEKITNAFEAGVIPIYWGDPMITDIYDARSFIHIPTLDNPNHQWDAVKLAVSRVQEAERDPQIYASYFQYPPMKADKCHQEDARVAASIRAINDELSNF
jgi:hypothetical protein